MASVLSQVFSIALLLLAAFALSVQGHRNSDSFGNSQVQSQAHSGLPTHIQDIIQRRTLLHGHKDKDGGPGGPGGYGGPGYGGKSWFKGGNKRRHHH